MATPNMNLALPTPTVTLGPAWATELNTALESVDSHDHSTGKGVKVKPDGLNINTDLDIQTNNLNNVLSTRLATQPSIPVGASDIQSLYSYDGNLYYNNDNGDAVRITNGTSIDASAVGGIGGDYGTTSASVDYNNTSKKYTFSTDTNRSGALDAGAITIRETDVLSSNGITLSSPAALSASYGVTFPGATPGSTQLLTMSSSGVLDFADTDETSLETTGAGVLQIKDLGVTEAKLAANAVTTTKIAASQVTLAKMASNSVGNSQIVAGAVDTDELANFAVTHNKLDTISVTQGGLAGTSSVAVLVGETFQYGTLTFYGSSCHVPLGPGTVVTASWTGSVSGTHFSATISNPSAGTLYIPLSTFNTIIPSGVAQTWTFAVSGAGALMSGGTVRFRGYRP